MKHHITIRIATLLLFIICCHEKLNAQYFPLDGDTINYTQVLFRFPWIDNVDKYKLEFYKTGNEENKQAVEITNNTYLAKSLEFGNSYKWRYCGVNEHGELLPWSKEYTFSIGTSSSVDATQTRYRIQSRTREKSLAGLLFFDFAKVAVDRRGNPVWYIPSIKGIKSDAQVRDLKMTKNGTFTALFDMTAIEFNRDGKIIWQAPDDGQVSGSGRENYHHEFTKLENGHYLVLGNSKEFRKNPHGTDSVNIEFGAVIIYDQHGKVVWCWNSKDYLKNEELFLRKRGADFYETMTHMNSCTINDSLVIVGFRDISRIVVIDRKTGKVKESYGGYGFIDEPHSATGFFRRQHGGNMLYDGTIAVLNNDSVVDPNVVSSVVIFSRITPLNPNSEKLFEFRFDFDTLTNGKSQRTGNLVELENGNLLVYMGTINRCIEVTRNSEVVADMFIEKYEATTKSWQPFPQYRVSYSPSLYTYEFTSRIIKKDKASISLRIFNIGHETDKYSIYAITNNKKIEEIEISIQPGQYGDVKMNLKNGQDYSIHVQPSNCSYSDKFTITM